MNNFKIGDRVLNVPMENNGSRLASLGLGTIVAFTKYHAIVDFDNGRFGEICSTYILKHVR